LSELWQRRPDAAATSAASGTLGTA